ncbi:hypothetical protein AKJ09_00552 [Labilithrix luteola]|uniref:Lipoprotein n=1 Tax=Labilithrix luteola TaxID=1391654 RepID=A0A0K1PK18_9BACT|nr:hypothetical protein [Labilithrix luteola]AKU93888.1 hypothetical protein AKJ09_00552 [Labilithrix luteola]
MRGLVVTLAIVGIFTACGGSGESARTPSGGRASCASDSDCVVVTKTGCCSACPDTPRAIPSNVFEQQKNRCAAVECAPASDRIECPRVNGPEGYVAVCKERTCEAVKRSGG